MPQQDYDPMQEFWKRAFDFLFKQSPVIVLAVIGPHTDTEKLRVILKI
jgi:hypothetical protein